MHAACKDTTTCPSAAKARATGVKDDLKTAQLTGLPADKAVLTISLEGLECLLTLLAGLAAFELLQDVLPQRVCPHS